MRHEELKLAGIEQGSEYLKKLSISIPEVYKNNISDYHDAFTEYVDNTKKFINVNEIQINNNNIELLPRISFRLYKDAKFCYYLRDLMGNDYERFIKDWIKLI